MSILSVDNISPIGSGTSVTLNSAATLVLTNANSTGVITATSFVGSGANLTSLPAQATIANNADNRVITGGSGVNLNGEANLTFDGSALAVTGNITSQKLTINSTTPIIDFSESDGNPDYRLFAENGKFVIRDQTSVIERFNIDSSGKIGINKLTPQYSLDIVGDQINLQSNASASNAVIRLRGQNTSTGGAIVAMNSAGNSGPLELWNGGNKTFNIDTSGRVTKPYHPSFYVRRNTGGDGRSAQNPVTEWSNPGTSESSGNPVHNRGGHFNYSTGLFTAPVSGIYNFSACAGYKQTNVDFNQKFVLNGGEMAEGVRFIGSPPNSHSTGTMSVTCYMASGNTMGVKMETTHHVNTTLNFFCGHLVA